MADEFRTFDKEPIVSVVRISRWSFGLREVILAVIAGLLLVLCLVFAGLFGHANDELASAPSASAIVGTKYCTDVGCLKTAARAVSFINKSVNPCENFYQYACGNFRIKASVSPNQGSRNVIEELRKENEDRIIDVLEQPISAMHDWAAERKLKKFFESCNDMYTRELNKGLPVLTKVIPDLGGWKLLGTWDSSTWDYNTALKKVQADYWVDAIYAPRVVKEQEKGEARIIQINSAGTGKWMPFWLYLSPFYERIQNDYKKFIRRVGSLMARDAADMLGLPMGNSSVVDDLLEEFVNDTYTMEYQIALLDSQRGFAYWSDEPLQMITLNSLTSQTNNVIQWNTLLSYLFNTAGVSGSTQVGIQDLSYFTGITEYLNSLPQDYRNRMLHNYFIWRVLEHYVQELSWEYVHANREVYVDLYNRVQFMGVYKYCFSLAEFYMSDSLNYLYITRFLSKENKDTAHEISDNIRLALKGQLTQTPWMDEATRKYAQEKLDRVNFKIGYPDWMSNQGEIDDMYSSLVINASDFFGNLLRMNQFRRASWNTELLRRTTGHEEWVHPAYDTVVSLSLYWNEVATPAGVLQFPIYDAEQPHSSTFGSLGSIMAMLLHRFVDERGQNFDKNGERVPSKEENDYMPGTWWSDESLEKYKVVKDCVKKVYSNLTVNVQVPGAGWKEMKVNASYMATTQISLTNGVKLSLLGYLDWVKAKGISEKMVPGLDMTWDQSVFLAHAQTSCEIRDPRAHYFDARYGRLSPEQSVNLALGQLPEFSKAFQCSQGTTMNPLKKCQYY